MKEKSFSLSLKEELCSIERSLLSKRAMLAGYAKAGGSIDIRNGEYSLDLPSESKVIAETLLSFIKDLYPYEASLSYSHQNALYKKTVYHVSVFEGGGLILEDLGIDVFSHKLPEVASSSKEEAVGYVTGSYLARGNMASPASSNYHLEFALDDPSYAGHFMRFLNRVLGISLDFRTYHRRKQTVVYLKKSQAIVDLMALLGASVSALEFEHIRMDREYSNVTNRWGNLDSANMGKTVKASSRQLEEIAYFEEHGDLEILGNEKLVTLCRIRKENEDASLSELSELLSTALNSEISRSNVNHLFRKLHEEYEKTKGR